MECEGIPLENDCEKGDDSGMTGLTKEKERQWACPPNAPGRECHEAELDKVCQVSEAGRA